MDEQLGLELEPRRWGGRRDGAGRKRIKDRHDADHVVRPYLPHDIPVHVVLRTVKGVPRLRQRVMYRAIRHALQLALDRGYLRVVHASIQHNHLHFIVEAETRDALIRGMQGLAISAARAINRACGRTGKVFAYRYHATPIRSPKQARHTISYVLNNWRRHDEDRGSARATQALIDPYSTGIWFTGWAGVGEDRFPIPADYTPLPAANAMSWLLTTGWQKHGLVECRERPGPLS